jgi:putative DNA primase/helicase
MSAAENPWDVMDGLMQPVRSAPPKSEERDAAIADLLAHAPWADLAQQAKGDLSAWLLRHKRALGGEASGAIRQHWQAAVDAAEAAARPALRLAAPAEPAPALPEALGRVDLPDLATPEGWECNPRGVFKRVPVPGVEGMTQPVRVAHRPIVVSGVLRDLDTDARSLVIEWSHEVEGWGKATVASSDTQDPRTFISLRDAGAPVTGRNARDLADWLDALEEGNATALPRAWHTHRLGWAGEAGRFGFLWGRTLLHAEGERPCDASPAAWGSNHVRLAIPADDGRGQLADGCRAHGTLDRWKEAIALILDQPAVLLGVYASLAAPFLGVVPDAPNAIVDWNGETSRGKTTTLRVAASVWGRPEHMGDGLMRTWDVSPAGLESLAEMSHCIPLILDDTKRASTRDPKGGGAVVASLIYQIATGQGRGRGRPDGMRRTSTWRTLLLSTGEASATSFTQDAGARARVLSITGSPLPGDSAALVARLTAGVCDNFGHAGPEVVRRLIAQRQIWPKIRTRYAKRVAYYTEQAGGSPVAARLAQTLALVELGGDALHNMLDVPRPEESPMRVALAAAIASSEDADRPTAALLTTYSWAVQHSQDFWERHQRDRDGNPRQPAKGWAGRWSASSTWSEIAFQPETLDRVLRFNGFNPNDILPRWQERGWFRPDGKNRGRNRTLGGEETRCICIPRTIFNEVCGLTSYQQEVGRRFDQPDGDEEIA